MKTYENVVHNLVDNAYWSRKYLAQNLYTKMKRIYVERTFSRCNQTNTSTLRAHSARTSPCITIAASVLPLYSTGTRYRNCLRRYATKRMIAGSVPDVFTGFLNWPSHSFRPIAPRSTQTITDYFVIICFYEQSELSTSFKLMRWVRHCPPVLKMK
jgi:hypothetical protein